jgi:hypothetical protein
MMGYGFRFRPYVCFSALLLLLGIRGWVAWRGEGCMIGSEGEGMEGSFL